MTSLTNTPKDLIKYRKPIYKEKFFILKVRITFVRAYILPAYKYKGINRRSSKPCKVDMNEICRWPGIRSKWQIYACSWREWMFFEGESVLNCDRCCHSASIRPRQRLRFLCAMVLNASLTFVLYASSSSLRAIKNLL